MGLHRLGAHFDRHGGPVADLIDGVVVAGDERAVEGVFGFKLDREDISRKDAKTQRDF